MNRKEFMLALAPLLAALGGGRRRAPLGATHDEMFEAIRQKYQLPGLAAGLVTLTGKSDLRALGVRRHGSAAAVTLADRWHLGSNTKMMTAVLAARLVEAGRLRWDTALGEVFPRVSFADAPGSASITLLQLLSHRSGLQANLDWAPFAGSKQPIQEQRLAALAKALKRPLDSTPGTQVAYSNLGYTVAGAMIESVTGGSWEDAMRAQVFGPLKMTSAGFGAAGTPGMDDEPWPHGEDGIPVSTKALLDNPPVMGPAGTVHCSLGDWARFMADQLRGSRGESALLQPASYALMQTAQPGGEYGLGWVVLTRAWADGPALSHAGSNTMNFAVAWLAPKKGVGLLACTNSGAKNASAALDETVGALLKISGLV